MKKSFEHSWFVSSGARKTFIFLGVFLSLGVATHVFAEGFTALAPIEGLTDSASASSVVSQTGFSAFFNKLYYYLIGLAATLAIIEIIWSGISIALHQDSVAATIESKGRIYNAIFGLVLVLSPALVFSIINPSILNLSLAIQPLKTYVAPPSSVQGGGGVGALPAAPTTGCTTAHSGPYLETAVCASMSAATGYSCSNGLALQVPNCKQSAAGSGDCLDTSIVVSCSGKTLTLNVYSYYQSYTGILIGDVKFVPSDVAASDAFKSACQNDGGVFTTTPTAAALAFLGAGVGVHVYQTTATNGCSSSYGVTVDASKGGGVVCFSNELSCNAPN